MTRSIVAAFLLASASPAFSQPVPQKVEQLRDAALKDDYAWDIVEGLTTEIGQRMAGTEAEARARDWAVRKLKSLGFSNVRVEPFDMPVWTRGTESAQILAPYPQKLAIAALGNSASTGLQGITGEVVGFDTLAEFEAAPDDEVRGKIAFVSHAMPRTQDGSSYGAFRGPRSRGPSIASRKGRSCVRPPHSPCRSRPRSRW